MHPSVDKAACSPTPVGSATVEIDCACPAARRLLKTSTMRSTLQALLCSVVATACAPIGEPGGDDGDAPDAGVGSAGATCDQAETTTTDITIAGTASFSGLPMKCWKLNGKLTLSGAAVTTLEKLGDLREVRDLVIDDTDLTKFDTKSIVEVTGDITIRYNDKLTDITNIVPKATAKSITVEYNAELVGLGGLSKAVIVTGATTIRNNNKLANLDLGRATRLEGGVLVQDNPVLGKLDLQALQSTRDFTIRNNAGLWDLGTLAALQYVHGTLTIDNNDNLSTLGNTMMSGNTAVDLGVVVSGNAKLSEIGGIAHLKYVGGTVTASGNSQLTYCEIREIDCCVNSGQVLHSGNQTSSCGVSGYSWCNQQLGYCPYMN